MVACPFCFGFRLTGFPPGPRLRAVACRSKVRPGGPEGTGENGEEIARDGERAGAGGGRRRRGEFRNDDEQAKGLVAVGGGKLTPGVAVVRAGEQGAEERPNGRRRGEKGIHHAVGLPFEEGLGIVERGGGCAFSSKRASRQEMRVGAASRPGRQGADCLRMARAKAAAWTRPCAHSWASTRRRVMSRAGVSRSPRAFARRMCVGRRAEVNLAEDAGASAT